MRVRGQALVEFALVAMLFLFLLMGSIDLARGHLANVVAANVAREAARYGASHLGQPGWEAAAVQAGLATVVGFDPASVHVSVTQVTGRSLPYVRASVSLEFHAITPLLGTRSVSITTESPAG